MTFTIGNALSILTPLSLILPSLYSLHTEAQRGSATCPRSHSHDLDLGHQTSTASLR